MLKTSQQKCKEIREDYLYEFVNLLEFLSDKEELPEEMIEQVSNSLLSDYSRLEIGYNNLKRIVTGSFLKIKNGQKIAQVSKPIQLEFYESFDDRATMKKKQAADLCEMSETWIHKHKNSFTIKGNLYIKEFLKWLKGYDINYYTTFRENYRKIS